MKTCPYCAETDLQDAAIVCKHCSRDIAPKVDVHERRIAVVALAFVLGLVVLAAGTMAFRMAAPIKIVESSGR
jgi:hypothetical protein